jgi:hypothetical protein
MKYIFVIKNFNIGFLRYAGIVGDPSWREKTTQVERRHRGQEGAALLHLQDQIRQHKVRAVLDIHSLAHIGNRKKMQYDAPVVRYLRFRCEQYGTSHEYMSLSCL